MLDEPAKAETYREFLDTNICTGYKGENSFLFYRRNHTILQILSPHHSISINLHKEVIDQTEINNLRQSETWVERSGSPWVKKNNKWEKRNFPILDESLEKNYEKSTAKENFK